MFKFNRFERQQAMDRLLADSNGVQKVAYAFMRALLFSPEQAIEDMRSFDLHGRKRAVVYRTLSELCIEGGLIAKLARVKLLSSELVSTEDKFA